MKRHPTPEPLGGDVLNGHALEKPEAELLAIDRHPVARHKRSALLKEMKIPWAGPNVVEAMPVVQHGVEFVPVEIASIGNDRELVQAGCAIKLKANGAVGSGLERQRLGLADQVYGSCHSARAVFLRSIWLARLLGRNCPTCGN